MVRKQVSAPFQSSWPLIVYVLLASPLVTVLAHAAAALLHLGRGHYNQRVVRNGLVRVICGGPFPEPISHSTRLLCLKSWRWEDVVPRRGSQMRVFLP
ncbi:hypothetical protein GE09DRAFT_1097081 [Coniochaeta sp. 2T2.1]|nr:hypothetical protein GE09DRAFT_1097081 [Coniochaeta sp. 2T2.1]